MCYEVLKRVGVIDDRHLSVAGVARCHLDVLEAQNSLRWRSGWLTWPVCDTLRGGQTARETADLSRNSVQLFRALLLTPCNVDGDVRLWLLTLLSCDCFMICLVLIGKVFSFSALSLCFCYYQFVLTASYSWVAAMVFVRSWQTTMFHPSTWQTCSFVTSWRQFD